MVLSTKSGVAEAKGSRALRGMEAGAASMSFK
jgi:hypothetical protein